MGEAIGHVMTSVIGWDPDHMIWDGIHKNKTNDIFLESTYDPMSPIKHIKWKLSDFVWRLNVAKSISLVILHTQQNVYDAHEECYIYLTLQNLLIISIEIQGAVLILSLLLPVTTNYYIS